MHIDTLLENARQYARDKRTDASLTVPDDWTQGRTTYGGLSAGITYAVMREYVSDDRVLRSFSCNFVGPLLPDTPFAVLTEVLRAGGNVTQVTARIVQNDKVCLIAQACFGVGRESKINVENTDTHGMEFPKKPKFIPQIPKITPKFLRHVDLSLVEGKMPFSNSKMSHIHGWMRFSKAPKTFTDAHLITLADGWPPATLQMARWPKPASSVSWNIEFIHPHGPVSGEDWFAYQAHTRQQGEGYGHTEANIWDAAGELVAISRQTVAIFD